MSSRHTLLCTVGTSLLDGSLSRLASPQSEPEARHAALLAAYRNQDWARVAIALQEIDPSERICGAEVNTIEECRRLRGFRLGTLRFLVSDTKDGRATGEVLARYYEGRRDLELSGRVAFHVVEGLNSDPVVFRRSGLPNLARLLGRLTRDAGGPGSVVIDATGGFKAQIAIAVVFGQAFGIPVVYKHESFGRLIEFPPLPIALDFALLGPWADRLADLEAGELIDAIELESMDERLRPLVEEVEVEEGVKLVELSAMGQIALMALRGLAAVQPTEPPPAESRERPHFPQDHFPEGFQEFVEKVWQEHAWVVTTRTLPYHGQAAIHGIGFRVGEVDGRPRLVGTYRDRRGFGARFWLQLSRETPATLAWAALRLNDRYRDARG